MFILVTGLFCIAKQNNNIQERTNALLDQERDEQSEFKSS